MFIIGNVAILFLEPINCLFCFIGGIIVGNNDGQIEVPDFFYQFQDIAF